MRTASLVALMGAALVTTVAVTQPAAACGRKTACYRAEAGAEAAPVVGHHRHYRHYRHVNHYRHHKHGIRRHY